MCHSHYDRAWEVLKQAALEFQLEGIPDHEVPPAIADFLVCMLLAMGASQGTSELAVITIIERMRLTLDAWRRGEPPFDTFNGKTA